MNFSQKDFEQMKKRFLDKAPLYFRIALAAVGSTCILVGLIKYMTEDFAGASYLATIGFLNIWLSRQT